MTPRLVEIIAVPRRRARGQIVLAGIDAQTRLGDALDAADGLGLLRAVLEGDLKGAAGLAVDDIEALDVAFLLHDAHDLDELLARRMDTVSLPADWALRTRVSMSAMGSVIVMFVFSFDP